MVVATWEFLLVELDSAPKEDKNSVGHMPLVEEDLASAKRENLPLPDEVLPVPFDDGEKSRTHAPKIDDPWFWRNDRAQEET